MVLWLILIKFGIKESGIATFFYIRVKIGLITSILKCKLIINKEFLSELNCHHLCNRYICKIPLAENNNSEHFYQSMTQVMPVWKKPRSAWMVW